MTSTVTVSGDGSVETEPNKAVVIFGVEHEYEGQDGAEAVRKKVSAKSETLRSALDEYEITSRGFDIRQQRRNHDEEYEKPHYFGSHSHEVIVEDPEEVGDVIETGVQSGATTVSQVTFTVDDETQRELRDESIEQAVEKARRDARVAAQAENMQLAGVEDMSVDSSRVNGVAYNSSPQMMALSADDTSHSTEIESGEVSVTANVSVEYRLT